MERLFSFCLTNGRIRILFCIGFRDDATRFGTAINVLIGRLFRRLLSCSHIWCLFVNNHEDSHFLACRSLSCCSRSSVDTLQWKFPMMSHLQHLFLAMIIFWLQDNPQECKLQILDSRSKLVIAPERDPKYYLEIQRESIIAPDGRVFICRDINGQQVTVTIIARGQFLTIFVYVGQLRSVYRAPA